MRVSRQIWIGAFLFFTIYHLYPVQLIAQGNASKAGYYIQSIASAKTDTDRVNGWKGLSTCYGCADSAEKMTAINNALTLAKSIKWEKGIIDADFLAGRYYGNCFQNFHKSFKCFLEGIAFAKKMNDPDKAAIGLGYMAQGYYRTGQFERTIFYYREMLKLKTRPDIKMMAFSNMGETYSVLGIYATSLSYYDSAMQALNEVDWRKDENKRSDSKALLKITTGDIYLTIGEYEHALANYSNALELCQHTQNEYGIILSLTGIGKAYQVAGKQEQAIEYFNKVLEKCKQGPGQSGYKGDELIVYNQLAKIYIRTGATAQALVYCQKAIALINDMPDNTQVPVAYTLLGELYTYLKKYDLAVFYLNKAIDYCTRSGALDNEKDALQALSIAYEQMKMPARSLEVYKKFISIRDSLHSIDKAKEITKHEMTADYDEKLAVQKAEQDKKDAIQKAVINLTIKKQRLAYVTFSVIIALLIFVGILLLNRFKLREKLEMQIAVTNERSRISSEMHDDMGSELSKISLLSEIVQGNVGDENAQSHLNSISRSSKKLLEKMGEIVWSLNDKYDTLESLMIYIRRYAMEYFSATDIDCKINMPEHFPDITMEGELRRNIFLIIKEALHNVLKHAKGDLVTINVVIDGHFMRVKIHDNGVGIDTAALSAFGNGLRNMKKRTEDVKGIFEVKNQNGTTIDFNFPLPA